jgi:hypothetical protein
MMTLVGGEMAAWSDRRATERAPAGSAVLAHLLSLLPAGDRVLLAGPHADELLTALRHTRVTCLLRSLSDATELAGRGVDVLCGTLPKLAADGDYDAVVALDGVDRLCSVEGPQHDWAESLHALRAALRPGGALLLAVENELGVHRLVTRATAPSDGGWNPVAEFDHGRPGNPTRLAGRLAADGLAVSWLGAAWPTPAAPTVMATPGAFTDSGGLTDALAAAAAGAVASAYAGRPVLSDPRRLAAAAVRGGLGAEFATSWLVLAHRAPGTRSGPAFPQALLGDVAGGPVLELAYDREGRWARRPVTTGPTAQGPTVIRDPTRLAGLMPTGRLLEELLLTAALRHDLPAARRLLTGYADWLPALGHGHAYATFDNVLVDDGRYALLDPSWDTTVPVTVPVAATRAARRFATTLITGGYAHPWPPTADVDALATVLAAAAGVDVDAALLTAAIDLDVAILADQRPDADPAQLRELVRDPGSGPPAIAPDGWREREELTRRLHEQLADAQASADFYAAELTRREAELRRLRAQVATFGGNPAYRLARVAVTAARRVRRRLLR